MASDSRYPWMLEPGRVPGLSHAQRRRLERFAAEVMARVGVRVRVDARDGTLFVHLACDPSVGLDLPPSLVTLRTGGRWDLAALDRVDELCRVVRTGRMGWRAMDRAHAAARRAAESRRRARVLELAESVRPVALDRMRFLRNRVGMGRTFRPSIVVPGPARGGMGR